MLRKGGKEEKKRKFSLTKNIKTKTSNSEAAKGMKNLWWVKVMVPTETLYILNAEVVLMTVLGVASPHLRG